MGKFTIKLSPLFIIVAFVLIYFGWLEQFVIYFIVLVLHEYAHYFVAKKLGYVLNKVVFMPYGAGLGGNNQIINPKHEILIALAGPLLNLILCVVCVSLWWLFPLTYSYTELFVFSNLALAIFNLIPVFPLDGGRVLVCVFLNKLKRVLAYKIMKITGFIFSFIFGVLFVVSVFYGINLTFFFICVFLFTSCFGNDANIYYERTYVENFSKKVSKPMLVKSYVINKNTPIYKMIKHINSSNFTLFYLIDDNNKIIKVVTESEILNKINGIKKQN